MKIGTITQVSGPVVDVEFEAGHLPKIKEALSVELNGQTRVMEVAQHMSERIVRCIMLAGSEGLARGMKVEAPGHPIQVPSPRPICQQQGGQIRCRIQAFADQQGHDKAEADQQQSGNAGNGPGQGSRR